MTIKIQIRMMMRQNIPISNQNLNLMKPNIHHLAKESRDNMPVLMEDDILAPEADPCLPTEQGEPQWPALPPAGLLQAL